MKTRYYAVLTNNGYYVAGNKKDAYAYFAGCGDDTQIIYTRSEVGNFYHDKIKTIESK